MASPARYPGNLKNMEGVHSQAGTTARLALGGGEVKRGVTALSVEFVAKPEEARRAESAIPAAVFGALKDVTGFAGCLVLVAEHEARLVTLVTLWKGADRARICGQNVRWVKTLLKPYLDRCLRVQTMNAQLPVFPGAGEGQFGEERCDRANPLELAGETVCMV